MINALILKLKQLLWLTILIILAQCGLAGYDTRYYLSYDAVLKVFKDEISENDLKGVKIYYKVKTNSYNIKSYSFFRNEELVSKHVYFYDDPNYPIQKKNIDSKGQIYSIEYFKKVDHIRKIVSYDINGSVLRKEFYNELQRDIKNILFVDGDKRGLLTKVIDYDYDGLGDKKGVYYYKYILYRKRIRRVEDKIEIYTNDKLVQKHLFYYNNRGRKTKREQYSLDKLFKVSFYDRKGSLEEEHEYNDNEKVISKFFYDENGKVVKGKGKF